MKCPDCKDTMEYRLGSWECDSCGRIDSPLDSKKSDSFLMSDEADFYVTDEKDIHLN